MANHSRNKFISRKQAADILSCSVKHIYRLDYQGKLKRYYLPGTKRPRYDKAEVERLIRSR